MEKEETQVGFTTGNEVESKAGWTRSHSVM